MSARTIMESEEWPVYLLDDAGEFGPQVDVPDDLAERYEAARKEWEDVQVELSDLFDGARSEWSAERLATFLAEHGSFTSAVLKTGAEGWKRAVEAKGASYQRGLAT